MVALLQLQMAVMKFAAINSISTYYPVMMVMMFLAMDATNARSKMVGIAQIMKF